MGWLCFFLDSAQGVNKHLCSGKLSCVVRLLQVHFNFFCLFLLLHHYWCVGCTESGEPKAKRKPEASSPSPADKKAAATASPAAKKQATGKNTQQSPAAVSHPMTCLWCCMHYQTTQTLAFLSTAHSLRPVSLETKWPTQVCLRPCTSHLAPLSSLQTIMLKFSMRNQSQNLTTFFTPHPPHLGSHLPTHFLKLLSALMKRRDVV